MWKIKICMHPPSFHVHIPHFCMHRMQNMQKQISKICTYDILICLVLKNKEMPYWKYGIYHPGYLQRIGRVKNKICKCIKNMMNVSNIMNMQSSFGPVPVHVLLLHLHLVLCPALRSSTAVDIWCLGCAYMIVRCESRGAKPTVPSRLRLRLYWS